MFGSIFRFELSWTRDTVQPKSKLARLALTVQTLLVHVAFSFIGDL